MPTFAQFKGINNVQPSERLDDSELATATDVDFGLSGEATLRAGFTLASTLAHRNVWEADGFVLATVAGDLTSILPSGARTVLYPSLGDDRVWYVKLPDGRVAYSNGLISGIVAANGLSQTPWGVPVPATTGALTDVAGSLFPGDYQYQLTYVRLSDGLEGGPVYTNPVPVALGGILLTGLPQLTGYGINVYITSHNGGDAHLAGMTLTSSFSYLGPNSGLVLPCRTDYMQPPPAGKLCATWRGRSLVAVGKVLMASRPHQPELFDYREDFKQFSDSITLVQPIEGDGIYVGTTAGLYFLAGSDFGGLSMSSDLGGPVVLGSGVTVPAKLIQGGQAEGSAMVCISGRVLTAGFAGGSVIRLTEGRYESDATAVAATFRHTNGVPQYIAVPQ